jgi:cardiolipin synthase
MADEHVPTFTAPSIEEIVKEKFSTANSIKLLWREKESFTTIFDAVRKARQFICLEFYIFRNDETGCELAEILKEKSREKVQVYLLYDHFGSFGTPRSFWNSMKNAGVRIAASRPFKWISPLHYVHRNHRKLIVIDAQKAFTGGLNIANEYSGFHLRLKSRKWRDTGIMLEGPIVNKLYNSFRKNWLAWARESIESPSESIQNSNPWDTMVNSEEVSMVPHELPIPVMPIFISSAKGRRKMRRLLYYSINHARKSISLTTAYFTPSRRMVETLEQAVARGARVRLLMPGITDVPAAAYAGRAFFTRLLKAGVEIYSYANEMLHAKTSLFDECWGIIGSTNLDFQSLRYNDEGNVGILDVNFASKMNDLFEEDIKHSVRIDAAEWQRRPLSEKLKEYFFSFFRRRL